jgi:hypothetical protein
MSDYTFRIWFSGLCHFVPNRDLSAACQLCVILPRAVDAECSHFGKVYTVDRYLESGKARIRPGAELQDLDDKRISFKITRADDLPAVLSSTPVFPAGVIDLEAIAGPFVDENDNIVSSDPDTTVVLSQLLIETGYSTGFDIDSALRTWTLPATLTNVSTSVTIADPVYIEFSGIRSVEMVIKPLKDNGTSSLMPLTPNGSKIEILVSNRCFTNEEDRKPRKLTADDIECRLEENGFRLVQIDKDFAFNYQMLHPTTLGVLSKFLPQDPQTGEPRYPVPESDLLSVVSALPIRPDDILVKLDNLLAERGEGFGRAKKETRGDDFRRILINTILDLIPENTGTGSGSDCLGSSGLIRFVDLDHHILQPGPAPTPLPGSSTDSLSGPLPSSTLGNPPQVVRNPASPAVARSRGLTSRTTPSAQAAPTAPSSNQPQNAPAPRKAIRDDGR